MNHTQITEILLTKSINLHYANRYMKFIQHCSMQHLTTGFESHHILPKAKTLFPEYSSLKLNPWNSIKLTPHQHFIAHWLLWKAMGNFMAYAFSAMRRKSKYQTNRYFKITGKVYNQLRIDVAHAQSTRIISIETRLKNSISQKNKPKIICPHCNKAGTESNMKRWHFDNCKTLTGIKKHHVPTPHFETAEFKDKTRERNKLMNTKEHTCPHCNTIGTGNKMFTYHFNNCEISTGFKRKGVKTISKDVTCPHCKKIGKARGMVGTHFDKCPSIVPKIKINCPHCNKEGNDNGYFRSFHINKCKLNNN